MGIRFSRYIYIYPGPSIATYILGTKKIRYELRFPARFEKNVRLWKKRTRLGPELWYSVVWQLWGNLVDITQWLSCWSLIQHKWHQELVQVNPGYRIYHCNLVGYFVSNDIFLNRIQDFPFWSIFQWVANWLTRLFPRSSHSPTLSRRFLQAIHHLLLSGGDGFAKPLDASGPGSRLVPVGSTGWPWWFSRWRGNMFHQITGSMLGRGKFSGTWDEHGDFSDQNFLVNFSKEQRKHHQNLRSKFPVPWDGSRLSRTDAYGFILPQLHGWSWSSFFEKIATWISRWLVTGLITSNKPFLFWTLSVPYPIPPTKLNTHKKWDPIQNRSNTKPWFLRVVCHGGKGLPWLPSCPILWIPLGVSDNGVLHPKCQYDEQNCGFTPYTLW